MLQESSAASWQAQSDLTDLEMLTMIMKLAKGELERLDHRHDKQIAVHKPLQSRRFRAS